MEWAEILISYNITEAYAVKKSQCFRKALGIYLKPSSLTCQRPKRKLGPSVMYRMGVAVTHTYWLIVAGTILNQCMEAGNRSINSCDRKASWSKCCLRVGTVLTKGTSTTGKIGYCPNSKRSWDCLCKANKSWSGNLTPQSMGVGEELSLHPLWVTLWGTTRINTWIRKWVKVSHWTSLTKWRMKT